MHTVSVHSGCVCVTTALWHNIYLYCLISMFVIHIITVLILDSISQNDSVSVAEIIIIIICVILEWCLIIIECKILHKYIFLTEIKPIFCLYLSKILAFSDIYLLMFKMKEFHFSIPASFNVDPNSSYIKITMVFLNYSISCQTLTGISSVSPKTIAAELLTSIQVLLFGIGYGIFILSIAVLRFSEPNEEEMDRKYRQKEKGQIHRLSWHSLRHRLSTAQFTLKYDGIHTAAEMIDFTPNCKSAKSAISLKPTDTGDKGYTETTELISNDFKFPDNKKDAPFTPPQSPSLSLFPDLDALESHQIIDESIRNKILETHHWMVYVKFIYNKMTFILFGTQIPRLIAMYYQCHDLDCVGNSLLIIGIILDIFLMVFCVFCVLMRMSLIQTFGIHVNITLTSLFRTYFTILFLFGILQFDVWVITKDTTAAFSINCDDIENYWIMLGHFIFYSVFTFTNVGTGDNIVETGLIGKILNDFEMLFGVIFSVVVFGVGLLHISEQRMIATEKFVKEEVLSNNHGGSTDYLSIDDAYGGDILELDIRQLVYRKSIALRKQGLLPRGIRPMVDLARQHSSQYINRNKINTGGIRTKTC